jgi:Arc/MetJ family transcription regulator
MRTNIELNDALLAEAMVATGQRTKRATIDKALRTLVQLRDDVAWLRKFACKDEVTSSSSERVTRTNIEIDDDLMTRALQAAEVATKRGAIEEALRVVIRLHRQKQAMDDLRGIGWEGDLDEMRSDWSTPPA